MKKKFINIGYVLFVLMLLNFELVKAQEDSDSLNIVQQDQDNKDNRVNVAFGSVPKEDLLGGVSTLNMAELLEKNYSTYSLDGIQSFIGGFNGNIWGQSALILNII